MRWTVMLLLVMALGYQLFFRYDYWNSRTHDGVVYERDNLTGEVREIAPGQRRDILARIIPDFVQQGISRFSALHAPEQPENQAPAARQAKPNRLPGNATVVSAGAPVPMHPDGPAFSVRQIDLNLDGQPEEIIQSMTDAGLDISIVKNGREILFGQGNQLAILDTRNTGWADVAIERDGRQQVFRYSALSGAYQAHTP